jgi:type VI secretion system protein ImpK
MLTEIGDRVHAILSYGMRLKDRLDRGESPQLEVEQSKLKGLLLSNTTDRGWTIFTGPPKGGGLPSEGQPSPFNEGSETDRFLGLRYALVCWLDEIFTIDSPWESVWNERKLEAMLYGTNERAWRFWEQAHLAEAMPQTFALEIFFLAVILGFRGELRENPDQLESWSSATQARIARLRGHEWVAPPELDPETRVPPLRGREALQRMLAMAGLTMLLLIPFVAFFIVRSLST